jgi:hypothetical protein
MKPATALTPPRFVNIAAYAVYGDLPAPLFQSYARLAGLAWNQSDKHLLPPLTLGELSVVLGCRERQTWEHLHALRRAGWLAWTHLDQRLLIRLTLPPLQTFASPGDGDVDENDTTITDHTPSSSSPYPPMQNFATNLAILAEFGVDAASDAARTVAQLPHVTPQFIRAWAVELQNAPKVQQLPALLLHKLRYTQQPPRREEHRGGARSRHRRTPTTDASPLPADVLAALRDIGWTDDLGEVAEHFAQDPARVRAWLEHARTSKTADSRAGLFRWGLRQASRYPPHPDSAANDQRTSSNYTDDSQWFANNEPMTNDEGRKTNDERLTTND